MYYDLSSAGAFPLKGEADEAGQALPLPRLAGDRHPSRGQRHDRHHRLSAETAAAVREPSHRRTLQVARDTSSVSASHVGIV